jgi:hypothetical protein
MFETYSIDSLAFHAAVIHPAFADIIPAGFPFKGLLNEFTLMPNVVTKAPIIDIRRTANILQRRDASCDIIYKKVFGATTRQISVEEIYGATQFCRNEFYQGALKDWRAKDELFGNKILPFFQAALSMDIASNAYFGDVDRVGLPTDTWSTTVFDGVFKWINNYINAGLIPSDQTAAIADDADFKGTGGPALAFALIKNLFDSQPILMNSFPDTDKAFYVSKEIAQAYRDYLSATAASGGGYIDLIVNGVPQKQLAYQGIPVLVEDIWTAVITQIKGSAGYAAVLTLRGNFVFATDETYGEGEDGHTALEVWYEKKDMTWYYRLFLKAGTQIALPEFIVVAMTEWT